MTQASRTRRARREHALDWGRWFAAQPAPLAAATAAVAAVNGLPHDADALRGCPPLPPHDCVIAEATQYVSGVADPAAQRETRRRSGAFHTPSELAADMARLALPSGGPPPTVVLDPACGGGSLLVAALERLIALHPAAGVREHAARIHGVEIDPLACAVARARIAARAGLAPTDLVEQIRCTDALTATLPAADLVVMNPPFGSAIKRSTRRTADERATLADRFPLAARGAYDRATLFLESTHRCCPAKGTLAAILPRALAVSPAAGMLRADMEQTRGAPHVEALPGGALGDADVGGALFIWSPRHATTPRARTPSPLLSDPQFEGLPLHEPLGAWLEIRASATVEEAYRVKSAVVEGGDGLRLVTAGAIEPGRLLWGVRVQRYLGERYLRPTVAPDALPKRRLEQSQRERVLVACLSRVIEAVAVGAGDVVGAVSTLQVIPREPFAHVTSATVEALLNHVHVRALYSQAWGAAALTGGNVPVTRHRLGAIVPADNA